MDPFTGTWIANLSKSQRHPNHLFHSATIRFDVSGDAVSLTHAGVNMSGKHESGTTKLHPDGKEHPVSAEAPGVVVVTRWLGSHILEMVAKKNGQVIGQGTYKVSSDGSTLTSTVWGTDANVAPCEHVIVYDRESTGQTEAVG